ncbi:glycine--tRNA ligase, partial [Candidatus Micrarchaeota archaeon]|nr:glycine--tRNA ligase [Candidatus Micrarchaeota archaeon]
MVAESVEEIINLCARRGMIFQNSEAYGVSAGFFDYGHYGALLKRRIENAFWKRFVETREDVIALESAIISPSGVWKASGHLDSFNDPLVECVKCKNRFRADHLIEQELKISVDGVSHAQLQELMTKHKLACPKCKSALSEIKSFNLMFKTHVGAVADEANAVYLRPETAQAMFIDFKTLQLASRKQLPFGIAQVGRSFRNEIAPRNFVFRVREFTQMEIEFFLHPEKLDDCPLLDEKLLALKANVLTAEAQEKADKEKPRITQKTFKELIKEKTIGTKWHAYWLAEFLSWFYELGLKTERLRLRQHVKDELSHYSSETWDVEYDYPQWGWKELMGVANRGDFDLNAHAKHSGKDFTLFEEETKKRLTPHVIEPSLGSDRLLFTLLVDAFEKKTENGETKNLLKLAPSIAPVQVAVFPLMKKDGLAEKARKVFELLREAGFAAEYDEGGSIGKRYARADEVGTPFAVTIDYDSLEKKDVTV